MLAKEKENILIDVRLCWEVFRITTDVDRIFGLIHSDPVYSHCSREGEVFEVHNAKVLGHAEIHDQVLREWVKMIRETLVMVLTIGS